MSHIFKDVFIPSKRYLGEKLRVLEGFIQIVLGGRRRPFQGCCCGTPTTMPVETRRKSPEALGYLQTYVN